MPETVEILLYFAVGMGYFGSKGWAWTLGIIVTIISVVLDVVQIAFGAVSNAFGLVIGLLILYYLTRPHVKAFFGKGPSTMVLPRCRRRLFLDSKLFSSIF